MGQMIDEPHKECDDAMDALRYFFVNHIKLLKQPEQMKQLNRWDLMKW